MENNTQLPVEVVEEIKEKAKLSADFLSNDEHVVADHIRGYEQGWGEGATAYATKLHELQQENEQLRQWKIEAVEQLMPIGSYAHKHLEVNLGDSCTVLVIAELDRLREENATLKAQPRIGWVKASIKRPDGLQLARFINSGKRFLVKFAPHVIADMAGKTYEPQELEYLSDESAAGREEDGPDYEDLKVAFEEVRASHRLVSKAYADALIERDEQKARNADMNLALAAMLNGYQNLSAYQKDWFTVPIDLINEYTKMVIDEDEPAPLTQARADFIREVNGRDMGGVEAVVLIKYIREHYKRCKGEWTDNYGIAKLTDQGVYELFKQQKEK